MRARNYGRIVLTSSASGLFGNFGQANYGAAKSAMIGLMNVLHLEGAKHDIRVNVLAPTARTGMTEGLIPAAAAELLRPKSVTPAVLFLSSEDGALARHSRRRRRGLFRNPHRRDRGHLSRRRRAGRRRRSPRAGRRFPTRRAQSRSATPTPRRKSSSELAAKAKGVKLGG